MAPPVPIKGVIFDLGDVLFNWSATTKTSVPAKTLRNILASDIWVEYDCGQITQDECYNQAATSFGIDKQEIFAAFEQARESLKPNKDMITRIHEIRETCKGQIKFYAMSNISKEDYAMLADRITDWAVFDRVFTSGHAGMRKPDPAFYQHVLTSIDLKAQEVVFIDDKEENVAAAQSVGISGQVFTDNEVVSRFLETTVNSPYQRGRRFVESNFDDLDSVTDSGVRIPDNFARLLIQETLGSKNLVKHDWSAKQTWNYFIGCPRLVPGGYFPDDLDTTSLALTVTKPDSEVASSVLTRMLEFVQPSGRFLTYYDREKPRTDEVVSANILACFYRYGRGDELPQTLDMVHEVLSNRTYMNGTRYYPSPDCCLYFFGRLLRSSDNARLNELRPLLRERVKEQVGKPGSTIDLAMRVLTCTELGVKYAVEVDEILENQCDNGSWQPGWMYRYGSTGVRIGNKMLTSAMAVQALACSMETAVLEM